MKALDNTKARIQHKGGMSMCQTLKHVLDTCRTRHVMCCQPDRNAKVSHKVEQMSWAFLFFGFFK